MELPSIQLVDEGLLLNQAMESKVIDVLLVSNKGDSIFRKTSEQELLIKGLECSLIYSIYYKENTEADYELVTSLEYEANKCKENLNYQAMQDNDPKLNYLVQDFKQGSIYKIGSHGGLIAELDSMSGFIRGFDISDSLLVWCSDSTEITIKNLKTMRVRKIEFDSNLRIHHDMVLHYPYLSALYSKKKYKRIKSYQVIDEGIVKVNLLSGHVQRWSILDFLSDELLPTENAKGKFVSAHSNSIEVDRFLNYYISFRDFSQIWKISENLDRVYYRIGKNTKKFESIGEFFQGQHSIDIIEPNSFYLYDNGATGGEKKMSRSRIVKVTVDSSATNYKIKEILLLPDSLSTVRMGSVKGLGERLVISVFNRLFNILEIDTLGQVKNHLVNRNSYAIKVLPISD